MSLRLASLGIGLVGLIGLLGTAIAACGGQVVLGTEDGIQPGSGEGSSDGRAAKTAPGRGDSSPAHNPDVKGFPPEPVCPALADPIGADIYFTPRGVERISDFDSDGVVLYVGTNCITCEVPQGTLTNTTSDAKIGLPAQREIRRIAATQGRVYFSSDEGGKLSVYDSHATNAAQGADIPALRGDTPFAVRRDLPSVVGMDATALVPTVRSWTPNSPAFDLLTIGTAGATVLGVGMASSKLAVLAQVPIGGGPHDTLVLSDVVPTPPPDSTKSFYGLGWRGMAVWQEKVIVAGYRESSAILRVWAMDPLNAAAPERIVDVANDAIPENVARVQSIVADYPKGSHDEGIFVAVSRGTEECKAPGGCAIDIMRVVRSGSERALQSIVSYEVNPSTLADTSRVFTVDRCFVYYTDGAKLWRIAR